MYKLICDMMDWVGVSEELLARERRIPIAFGETLSWRYYTYARQHPIDSRDCPTEILDAGNDGLTGRTTMEDFVRRFH